MWFGPFCRDNLGVTGSWWELAAGENAANCPSFSKKTRRENPRGPSAARGCFGGPGRTATGLRPGPQGRPRATRWASPTAVPLRPPPPTGPGSTLRSGSEALEGGTVPEAAAASSRTGTPGVRCAGGVPFPSLGLAEGRLPVGVCARGCARVPAVGPGGPGVRRARGLEQRPACHVPKVTPSLPGPCGAHL